MSRTYSLDSLYISVYQQKLGRENCVIAILITDKVVIDSQMLWDIRTWCEDTWNWNLDLFLLHHVLSCSKCPVSFHWNNLFYYPILSLFAARKKKKKKQFICCFLVFSLVFFITFLFPSGSAFPQWHTWMLSCSVVSNSLWPHGL